MSVGLNYLLEQQRRIRAARNINRSLFEGSMGFLLESGLDMLEADAEEEGTEGGEGAPQAKEDKQLAGMMPKAMDATLDAFNGFKSVKAMPEKMQTMFNEITKKVSDHVQDPDTPEALSDFKTAEELHALIVMSVDRYAVAAQAKIKAGQKASDIKFTDIFQKAIKDSQAVISNKISKLPFLQRAIEKFKEGRKGLEDRLSGLYPNWRTAILSIGEDPEKALAIATDRNFAGQRDIQGTVVSSPKIDPNIAKSAQEQGQETPAEAAEEGKLVLDDKKKKLVDLASKRVDDYKAAFKFMLDNGEIEKNTYSIAMKVLGQFTGNPKETYENLVNNLGPKGQQVLDDPILKVAANKFEDLDATLEDAKEAGAGKESGGALTPEKSEEAFVEAKKRIKDLKSMIKYKTESGEMPDKDATIAETLLDKIEKSNDFASMGKLGEKTRIAFETLAKDYENGWEDLDSTLKSIKKSAPKVEIDFGVPLDKLEEIMRNFIDAPADKSQSAIQNEFIKGLEEAGSDEKTYSAAFAKLEKYGGIDNPKSLKAMGLEKLASEKGSSEEGAPEAGGKSLSSILFNSDASIKKKLDPSGEKIKASLMNLKTVLDSYASGKGGKTNRAALVAAIKDSQESIKGMKLESVDSKELVIVERWQKLAGIL